MSLPSNKWALILIGLFLGFLVIPRAIAKFRPAA